jgi:hypothetical protein
MRFNSCKTGWKSISLGEAKARAGVSKRGMTQEERDALKPALKPLKPKITSKKRRLAPGLRGRYERAVQIEAWALLRTGPWTLDDLKMGMNITESLARDTVNLCRIKIVGLQPPAVGNRGRGKSLYQLDRTMEIEDPALVLKKYGV